LSDAGLLGLLPQLALALQLSLLLGFRLLLRLGDTGLLGSALLGKPVICGAELVTPLLFGLDLAGSDRLGRGQWHRLPLGGHPPGGLLVGLLQVGV
jgi:hypothetical protein